MTQQGWICPRCGQVNAPWKPKCDCVPQTTTGSAKYPLLPDDWGKKDHTPGGTDD